MKKGSHDESDEPLLIQQKTVRQLMVICGAVAAGLLTKVLAPFVTVTIIGTSPAPANEAGSLN
jgi:hypothetical protein